MANIPIWNGTSTFTTGSTPFGFYDDDASFQEEADKIANWCSKRLGYPIVDVELQDVNFYAAFEEAVSEYGNQVNTYVSRDNILYLLGANTGSANISQEYIQPRTSTIFKLSDEYGAAAGVGGNETFYTGSIDILDDVQTYDLVTYAGVSLETGSFSDNQFTIRKLHHYPLPAMTRYVDPFAGTGLGIQNLVSGFGWGGYTPASSFMLHPINHDLLRIQGIELNDQIRKSAYSFSLINNRLKIFPIPTKNYKIYFEYTLNNLEEDPLSGGEGKISDISNIPYQNMVYSRINQLGKQWIRRYTLAICKEMLGYIRGKYSAMPIPGSEVTLNSADLIAAAESEKVALLEELREILDQFSRQNLLERKNAEVDSLENQLKKIPLKFYIG